MSRPAGFHHTPETKQRIADAWAKTTFVRKHTPETKEKIRIALIKRGLSGAKHPNWQGGKTALKNFIRKSPKSKRLTVYVLKRDKYTCQLCGQVGGHLEVDHIKPFANILNEYINQHLMLDIPTFAYELYLISLRYSPFWDKQNLRTLCLHCNRTRNQPYKEKNNVY